MREKNSRTTCVHIKNASSVLDLMIMLLTVKTVLSRRGAQYNDEDQIIFWIERRVVGYS